MWQDGSGKRHGSPNLVGQRETVSRSDIGLALNGYLGALEVGSGEGISRQWDGICKGLEEGVVIILGYSLGHEEVIKMG